MFSLAGEPRGMRIIIHRGADEIGGTCVEVSAGNTRVLLDFGMPLGDGKGGAFDEKALEGKSIRQLIGEKVLYPIKGLYRDEAPTVDAILISHSHKDHYGFLKFAHPAIPVYMSSGAEKLINVLNIFIRKDGRVVVPQPKLIHNRVPFDIGDLQVTPYLVDHSAFDAMSFLVEEKATGKRLFYSGDFRAAGWKDKLFERFVAHPPQHIDCLLMEGTMIGREAGKYAKEQDILARMIEILRETDRNVVFACCSGQNIDRIVTFYKAARRTGSLLVIDPYTACALKAIENPKNKIPQMDWTSVRVFIANYYGHGDIYVSKINDSAFKGLLPGLGRAKIKPNDFPTLRQKVILLMRDTMIPALQQIPAIKGSKLVYSQWHGYLDKEDDRTAKLKSFIREHDLDLEHVHTSGHATVDKLKEFVNAISPSRIIPVHTQFPGKFGEIFGTRVFRLPNGQALDV